MARWPRRTTGTSASSNTASREALLPLPEQFDEYIWFDQTSAVTALAGPAEAGLPDTYPFGL